MHLILIATGLVEYSNTQYEIHQPAFACFHSGYVALSQRERLMLRRYMPTPQVIQPSILPQGSTIAGTTDSPTEVTHSPSPSEGDIQFILNEVKNYLTPDIEVRRGDVASAWAGIRPLVRDPNNPSDTQNLVRFSVLRCAN